MSQKDADLAAQEYADVEYCDGTFACIGTKHYPYCARQRSAKA